MSALGNCAHHHLTYIVLKSHFFKMFIITVQITIKDHKKYVLFLKDQINMKNFMRTKIILFKFYKNSKHILPYFILPLVIYCILYIR